MNTSNQKTLVIAGFHRSGTSMAAQIVAAAGMYLGRNILGGDRSNPLGHVEDLEIINLHDDMLEKHGTSWLHDGSMPLVTDTQDIESINNIVAETNIHHDVWGFKDPRATLFLEPWAEVLGNTGVYLLMFRHYSQCVQSLYKRHSRRLCLPELAHGSYRQLDDIVFWKDPDLVARMWLEYNKRILKFYETHKHRCLLVSQEMVLSGYPLAEQLNSRFELDIRISGDGLIKRDLTESRVCSIDIDAVSAELRSEMDEVWERLCASSGSDLEENIEYVACDTQDELDEKLSQLIARYNSDKGLFGEKDISENDVTTHNSVDRLTLIKSYLFAGEHERALNCVMAGIQEEPLNFHYLVQAATVYKRLGENDKAQSFFSYAVAVSPDNPFLYLHLGDCLLDQNKLQEAGYFLHKALDMQSEVNNPAFFYQLGRLYLETGENDLAEQFFLKALDMNPEFMECVIVYSRLLIRLGRKEDAKKELLKAFEVNKNQADFKRLALVFLAIDQNEMARKCFRKQDEFVLSKIDLNQLLKNLIGEIENAHMKYSMKYWVCRHWS